MKLTIYMTDQREIVIEPVSPEEYAGTLAQLTKDWITLQSPGKKAITINTNQIVCLEIEGAAEA